MKNCNGTCNSGSTCTTAGQCEELGIMGILNKNGSLHIIQNDPEVPPGNITDHLQLPHSVHHPYINGHIPDIGDISALIVLGGAMGAHDDHTHPFLSDIKKLICRVVETGIPYLGICLGGQLLAAALGASVISGRWQEIGTCSVTLTEEGSCDPLFAGIPREFNTFQWHHDSFNIPGNASLLAFSETCPNQAFRCGNFAWGLQFHPEVTENIIRNWCVLDDSMSCRTNELIATFSKDSAAFYAHSRRLLHNFLITSKMTAS